MRAEAATALRSLCEVAASGAAILFTGAGFSTGATNHAGNELPTSDDMRRDLWQLAIGDGTLDRSSLQDLYDVARVRCPKQLSAYLRRHLRVVEARDDHVAWLSMPWHRIYTLNVDDLETCVQRRTRLPRRLVTVTAADQLRRRRPGEIDVVHLNGLATDGADGLTFSTLQYAARLGDNDRMYATLADDLVRRPFVFVGTTLDEVVLWQHLQLKQRLLERRAPIHPSFLVTRTLSRARQLLLEDLGVRWLRASIAQVARWLAAHRER